MEVRTGSLETDEALFRWLLGAAQAHADQHKQHALHSLVAALAGQGVPRRAAARLLVDALALSLGEVEPPRRRGRSGGQRSAAARALKAVDSEAWTTAVFDKAYNLLAADCPARIGWSRLQGQAWRLAGRGHPRREELTEHRARQYLKKRRLRSR